MIARDLVSSRRTRKWLRHDGLRKVLDERHFFECTSIIDISWELALMFSSGDMTKLEAFRGLAFLPAPKVWLEFKHGSRGDRMAYILTDVGNRFADFHVATFRPENILTLSHASTLPLDGNPMLGKSFNDRWKEKYTGVEDTTKRTQQIMFQAYAMLSMINQPNHIGRRTHQPHSGLIKKLSGIGMYPLKSWTEIILHAMKKPTDESDLRAINLYLTNRMPLHFVRSHKARYHGKNIPITVVAGIAGPWKLKAAIWRGDPALGIKLTRYRVEP